jgi:uncharacterized protein (DUF2141 family)
MRTRFSTTIRAIQRGLALVSLSALLASSASAAYLSGTLVDHSSYTSGLYHVYLVRLSLDFPIAGSTIALSPGYWEIRNVPPGHYFVVAWRDVNRNFVPSRGEPIGYYGVPFPSRVTVGTGNITGLQVVLDANNLGAEVRGNVTYNGNKTGRIWVVPHITPDLELTTVRGTPWTMTSLGDYQSYILDHGRYYLTAFMDVNGNLLCDQNEPFGISKAVDIVVTPGVSYVVDIHMDDRITAVETSTWSKVKGLYND